MDYTQVKITSTSDKEDLIIGILYDLEIYNFDEENQAELVQNKIWTDNSEVSGTKGNLLEINVYLDEEEINKLNELKMALDKEEGISLGEEIIQNKDWENDWKKQYKVLTYAGNIVIQPVWEEYEGKPEEIIIQLDAGMPFSDGDHETTQMCIQLLKKYVRCGDKVVDVGTGNGILAILASKLGASEVVATEIDEYLLTNAKDNVALNEIHNVKIEIADLLHEYSGLNADVIVANIIAELGIEVANDLRDNLKPGGILIISAVQNDKLDMTLKALKDFKIIEVMNLGKWNSIVVTKN